MKNRLSVRGPQIKALIKEDLRIAFGSFLLLRLWCKIALDWEEVVGARLTSAKKR